MTKPTDVLSDTNSIAATIQVEVFRGMAPVRKVALVEDANRTSRLLALAGIRARYPEVTSDEETRLLMDLVLGKDLAQKAYGPTHGPKAP